MTQQPHEDAGGTPSVAELTARLSAPFPLDAIHFKPAATNGNRCLALAYVDARAIQERLDEVLGIDGWQDEYDFLEDGSCVCRLRLRLGGEWITKVDVGGESEQKDQGDRRKAAVSDALKRAAVKFGIGRYLYRLPQQWVDYDPRQRKIINPPPLPPWAIPAGTQQRPAQARQAPQFQQAKKPQREPQQPANGNGRHTKPKDGRELLARLQRYEQDLVLGGVCRPGELLAAVRTAAVAAKVQGTISEWSGPAIDLAVEAATKFAARTPHGDQIRALARRLGWSNEQVMVHVGNVWGHGARPDTLTGDQAAQIILDLEDRLKDHGTPAQQPA